MGEPVEFCVRLVQGSNAPILLSDNYAVRADSSTKIAINFNTVTENTGMVGPTKVTENTFSAITNEVSSINFKLEKHTQANVMQLNNSKINLLAKKEQGELRHFKTASVLAEDGSNLNGDIFYLVFDCSNFSKANDDYGKYIFSFTYYSGPQSKLVEKSFTYTIYILASSNYDVSTISNATPKAPEIAQSFYSAYEFKSEFQQYPKLTFDGNFYKIKLTYIYANMTNVQTISVVNNAVVKEPATQSLVFVNKQDSLISMVFNNIGEYKIQFLPIQKILYQGSTVVEELNNPQTKPIVQLKVLGAQLFHSTVSGSQENFCKFDNNGNIDLQNDKELRTDFSYLSTNSNFLLNYTNNFEGFSKYFIDNTNKISSTNQTPVFFRATNSLSLSKYWKLEGSSFLPAQGLAITSAFSEVGTYLVNACTYDNLNPQNPILVSNQWFCFKISNVTSKFEVKKIINGGAVGNDVYADEFLSEEVSVKYATVNSPFDAPTKLTVMHTPFGTQTSTTTVVEPSQTQIFKAGGRYTVTLSAKYGSGETISSKSLNFVIDDEQISEIKAYTASYGFGNSVIAGDELKTLYTNQFFAVTWNEKRSGTPTQCEYIRIPLQPIVGEYYANSSFGSQENGFVNLRNLLDSASAIPAQANLNFSSDIANSPLPYVKGTLQSQSGLYIFHITDTSGHESFKYVMLDNSNPVLLQIIANKISPVNAINVIGANSTVVWGKNKVILFNNLDPTNISFNWLKNMISSPQLKSSFLITDTSLNKNLLGSKLWLSVPIIQDVYLSVGGNQPINVKNNNSSHEILFLDANGNANETSYMFFVRDLSNTKTIKSEIPSDVFTTYPSTIFNVKVSSDCSATELYFKNASGGQSTLNLARNIITEQNVKQQFYAPTNAQTLKYSNEVLHLRFNPAPNVGIIEVEKLEIKFYPFVTMPRNDTIKIEQAEYIHKNYMDYSLVALSNIVVWDRTNKIDLTALEGDFRVCDINLEYYFNGEMQNSQTRAGKYVLTRTYATLAGADGNIASRKDFNTREITFYIDRNDVITMPEVIDLGNGNVELVSLVGGAIKAQVTDDFFTNIYIVKNLEGAGEKTILRTNKLPVKLFVPEWKYGYDYFNLENKFKPTANKYAPPLKDGDPAENNILNYKIKATIRFSTNYQNLINGKIRYQTKITDVANNSGFYNILDMGETDRNYFKDAGFYQVEISTFDVTKTADSAFIFVFQIINESPKFNILDVQNNEFQSINNKFFTNKDIVRISWQDSLNEFMAKIDKTKIEYTIYYDSGLPSIKKIAPETIISNEQNNYFDLNIGNFGSVKQIDFKLSYEGRSDMFNTGFYSTTKSIVIDKIAPDKNINKLVLESGIAVNLLRDVAPCKNISTTSVNSKFGYFAFSVDKASLASTIEISKDLTGQGLCSIFYKEVVNKYPLGGETSVELFNSSTQFMDLYSLDIFESGKYYEIVEVDWAGNLTIYTIFVTDVSAQKLSEPSTEILKWTTVTSKGQSLFASKFDESMTVYSKDSFNLIETNFFNYKWCNITINANKYFFSPYLEANQIFDANGVVHNLKDIVNLLPSEQLQTIIFGNVPQFKDVSLKIGILSENLKVFHFNDKQIKNLNLKGEGIIVQIPASIENLTNIFATSIKITRHRSDQGEIDVYNLSNQSYFTSPLESGMDIISGTYSVSNFSLPDARFFKLSINNPIANDFYVYEITDNYGTKITFTTLFGSDFADGELQSEVDILQKYENGVVWNYSTKNVTLIYNALKDIIVVTQDGTSYRSNKNSSGDEVDQNKSELALKFIIENIGGTVWKITFEVSESIVNGIYGGVKEIKIDTYSTLTKNDVNAIPYRTQFIKLLNIQSTINLLGPNYENMNNLFAGEMGSGPVSIRFKDMSQNTTLKSIVEMQNKNGVWEQIESGLILSEFASYKLRIKFTSIFTEEKYNIVKHFTLTNISTEFYYVRILTSSGTALPVEATGNSYVYIFGGVTKTLSSHYIINTENYEIVVNTVGQMIRLPKLLEARPVENGFTTYLYEISNFGEVSKDGKVITYFEKVIAITVITQTSNILDRNFSIYNTDGTTTALTGFSSLYVMKKEDSSDPIKKVTWQSYYGTKQNLVNVSVIFNNQLITNPKIERNAETNKTILTLDMSGDYVMFFSDIAGNVHKFISSTSVSASYTIRFIKNVVFEVNGQTPIENAIYSEDVTIVIPLNTIQFYDSKITPTLNITKNGTDYLEKVASQNSGRKFVLKEPGLYVVYFSAITGGVKVREEKLTFQIIAPNESRWAYEWQQFGDYVISKVTKNDVDVTSLLEKKFSTNQKLRSLLISIYDVQTGQGRWQFEISTNNSLQQKFVFDFWINNAMPPLNISIAEGKTTIDNIVITFNAKNLVDKMGDCIFKVGEYETLYDEKVVSAEGYNPLQTSIISTEGTHYIQILTKSGRLLYSYMVIKKMPLNTAAIAIIVVSVVVVLGIVIFVVFMRKRFKVR